VEPKTLQTVAMAICKAFLEGRIEKDLARLRELHTGLIRIDLLTGECFLDEFHTEPLEIAPDLQAMLEPELKKLGVRAEDVTTADLVSRFAMKTGAEPPKAALRLDCSGRIEAFGRDYVAHEVAER
jgi:hypothetical protein